MSIKVIDTNNRSRETIPAGTVRQIITANDGAKGVRAAIHEIEPGKSLEFDSGNRSRLPQFQVAIYSLLQLASLIAYGFGRSQDFLPLPKWRRQSVRPSAADLIDLLRSQLLRRSCTSPPPANFIHFNFMAPLEPNSTKIAPDLCQPAA